VRLANGVMEDAEAVGRIWIDLRWLLVEHPWAFRQLAELCHGQRATVDTACKMPLGAKNFLKEDGQPWDDVRDVVLSGVEEVGRQWRMGWPLLVRAVGAIEL